MKIISFNDIKNIGISPLECVNWVNEALRMKGESLLPKKISLAPNDFDHVFYNTMPCIFRHMNRGGSRL